MNAYNINIRMTAKQLTEMKQQIKREILDLDHQINELETFYIEDTKEAGNLLKGFDNYISLKTSKIQSLVKKQKVESFERLFSVSSSTSKTSNILEQSFLNQPMGRIDMAASNASKRNRPRQGKTKSGGKNLMVREENMMEEDQQSQSGDGEGNDDSLDDSLGKSRQINKKKKQISKNLNPRKG